jgi:2-dehydro-3-deoxygalactonokinase
MTQSTETLLAQDPAQAQAVLIGLDWGTSSLRSYLFDAAGEVVASEALPWGIMRLPKVDPDAASGSPSDAPVDPRRAPFELAFEAACGAWLTQQPELPVIACGMVGSAQGWTEVPYVEGEVDATVLAQAMVTLGTRRNSRLHIVPGVLERGVLPNVMRGEETQIVGVSLSRGQGALDTAGEGSNSNLNSDPNSVLASTPTLIGLPGTHAKWALSEGGRIGHFDTFMTGEVFAILRDHSILGRTMSSAASSADGADAAVADAADAAFLRGIAVARSESDASLLATIFSVRTLGLTGQLEAGQQGDYLSGLLIGNELISLEQRLSRQDGVLLQQRSVVLSGEASLCARYRTALAAFGCTQVSVARNATERGLWHIAVHAGLVSAAAGDDAPAPEGGVSAAGPNPTTECAP